MINTVIFDFDGTLADTSGLVLNSFKHIYSKYHNRKCDEEYILSIFGEPLEITLRREFADFKFEDVMTSYREYQNDKFEKDVKVFDTVIETLDYLKSNNFKLGIATSRLRASTLWALKVLKIDKYFEVLVAVDDVIKHKPNKEALIKVINQLNSSTESSLYVGDSKYDMECALNAEVTPVLVGWHSNSKSLAEEYNIKHILDKMWDLTELLK
ncbi:MAG: HAD-IA family hydrolase [Tissierellia bacterium]|nr:HAD-IA family hydrolase [Tissierellia bacterium]